MFFLLNILVYAVLVGIMFAGGFGEAMFLDGAGSDGDIGVVGFIGIGLIGLWALGTLIPNIALQVRRLHDLGQTGWIYLGVIIGGLIPVVGGLVQLGFLIWMAFPGNVGPNKYGDDPKDPANTSVFE